MRLILGVRAHRVRSAVPVDHPEQGGLMSSILSGHGFATRRDIGEARDWGVQVPGITEE